MDLILDVLLVGQTISVRDSWLILYHRGAVTIGLGGVQNFAGVTAVRFVLGMFEAGSYPSFGLGNWW